MKTLSVSIVTVLILGIFVFLVFVEGSINADFTEEQDSVFGSVDDGAEWHDWGHDDHYERLTGRDFVQLGQIQLISGNLLYMDGEWFVQTESHTYEIHLGDHDYRENLNIGLEVGKKAFVYGFVYGHDVAVISLILDDNPHIVSSGVEASYTGEKLQIVSGVLNDNQGDWAIQTATSLHELNMMNDYDNAADINLLFQSGQEVILHMISCTDGTETLCLSYADTTYEFRNAEGRPLWAGSGRGDALGRGYGLGERIEQSTQFGFGQ